jgi:ribosomal protein S26
MSSLRGTRGQRQGELGHVKLCCNCDSYIIKNSTLKKFEKNDNVVKGACVTFVEAFPLATTVVTKKLSDLYPVVAGNK